MADELQPAPRAKTESLGIDPETKRKLNSIIGGILAALLAAGWAKVDACQAKQSGEAAAVTAKTAKVVTDAAYEVTKDKVDPQGEALQKLRDDLNVLLAEREAVRQRAINKGAVVVPEAVPPTPVEPAAVAPLPANPALDAGAK